MADLYRGPHGVVFSPGEGVHEDTIKQRVDSGEWVPVEEKSSASKPAAKKAAPKSQAK